MTKITKLDYPITTKYCETWTITDAIREVIANALDSKDNVSINWGDNITTIHNHSTAMDITGLLFGETDKAEEDDVIGQFGEGYKIAALTCCRLKRSFTIKSKGLIYEFHLDYNKAFERNIMVVDIKEDKYTFDGTIVSVQCTEKELDTAKKLFLDYNHHNLLDSTEKGDIFSESKDIYVQGVKIGELDTLFGYNLKDKGLLNRDRNIVDQTKIKSVIENILEKTTSEKVIKTFLDSLIEDKEFIETFLNVWSSHSDVWNKVLSEFGKIAIESFNEKDNVFVEQHGYKVVSFKNINNRLHSNNGVPLASEIAHELRNKITISEKLPRQELTLAELLILDKAWTEYRSIFKEWGIITILVHEPFEDKATNIDGNIILSRDLLSSFADTFLRICLEGSKIHSDSDYPDRDEIIRMIAEKRLQ